MKAKQGVIILAALAAAFHASAIEGLKIRVQCPNVLLSWPSRTGEIYIVQYRPTLNINTPWVSLTNSLPAAVNTNWTSVLHLNAAPCPPAGAGGGQGGGGGGLPTPLAAQSSGGSPTVTAAQRQERRQQAEALGKELMAMLKEAAARARSVRESRARIGTNPSQPQAGVAAAAQAQVATDTAGFYRVVRTGVYFFGITNGQVFSDLVTLPVEIGLPNMTDVPMEVALAPIADGQPDTYPAGVQLYLLDETSRSPALPWDTHRATNGTYVLKAAVTLKGDTVVAGAPVTVIVSNRIQMPKIADVIVSGLPIYAIIDQPSASYTVTIRNAQGQVVRTLTGQAVNYIINNFWNGRDEFGNNALVNHSYVDMTLSYNPSYTHRVWVFFEDNFVDGNWLIAYLKGEYSPVNEILLDNAMQQISDFALEEGLASTPYLQIRRGAGSWVTMTNALKLIDTRNFYYWGHGGPSGLGFGGNDRNNGATALQLERALGNMLVTNEIQIRHAFRFVWLDGCETGTKSSALPQAFGIQPVQLSAQAISINY